MHAVCPHHPAHAEFITGASITQDWKVDAHGQFLEVIPGDEQILHGPCPENLWTCALCGAEATVTR